MTEINKQIGVVAVELSYLVLVVDLLVGQVGDRHLVVGGLPDLVLGPLGGLACVQEVTQALVVDFNEACRQVKL